MLASGDLFVITDEAEDPSSSSQKAHRHPLFVTLPLSEVWSPWQHGASTAVSAIYPPPTGQPLRE